MGIQADMQKKPEGAAVQEGEDDYTTYKAAGKVSPLLYSLSSSADVMSLNSCKARRLLLPVVTVVLDELLLSCMPWRVPT